jgi:hypothetical protein
MSVPLTRSRITYMPYMTCLVSDLRKRVDTLDATIVGPWRVSCHTSPLVSHHAICPGRTGRTARTLLSFGISEALSALRQLSRCYMQYWVSNALWVRKCTLVSVRLAVHSG